MVETVEATEQVPTMVRSAVRTPTQERRTTAAATAAGRPPRLLPRLRLLLPWSEALPLRLAHREHAAAARAAVDFFRWAYADGTEQAKSLDYVPLPAELVTQIEAYWTAQLK